MTDLDLFEQDLEQCSLLEGALALNAMIFPETDKYWVTHTLNSLFEELEQALVHDIDDKQKFESFLRIFFHEWGFHGDSDEFFNSDNTRVDLVLKRRKGIPVSLGAIMLHLGMRLGFPMEGVSFPSQFIIKLTWPNQAPIYINPFDGEYVSKSILRAWLIGYEGPLAKLKPQHLAACDNPSVLGRWLAVIKGALLREDNFEQALKCTNIALSFVPDDPYEIRDRGFIYQQLDCQQLAADDFQYFIDNCPDDPSSEMLKIQVNVLSGHLVTLH
ncbi:SirB1 family protein [Vibrio gangliei]|uniref:SirB1 family protein n=1 Tax=Vibrio gangliei TaxID=2077090 RepID=UPI000D0121A6|nr:SirB1 family protein [Vibrio gangliei]